MKVYELMNKLKDFPAGAEVNVRTIKTEDEMTLLDDETYEIFYPVKSAEMNEGFDGFCVEIDCY